jgi:hypothetical protein
VSVLPAGCHHFRCEVEQHTVQKWIDIKKVIEKIVALIPVEMHLTVMIVIVNM